MRIAIPCEVHPGEKRVAVVPETVGRLIKLGHTVQIEKGAGLNAEFRDADFERVGAALLDDTAKLYSEAELLLKVRVPEEHPLTKRHEIEMLSEGALLLGFFFPLHNLELVRKAQKRKIRVLALDAIPRITRAQRMDVLSSQSNLAGYKAALLGANALGKIFPLMMTAAGTIPPARVLVMGAGVAGLQAIATARRLGAIVEATDVRAAVKEEVESLGAKFIAPPGSDLADEGGYAKEASDDFLRQQKELLNKHAAQADVIITTALVPGKRAPILVSEEIGRAHV